MDAPLNVSSRWLAYVTGLSIATFVVSAAVLPWLLTRLPADYFVETEREPGPPWPRHPLAYWAWRVAKNILGLVLLAAGVVMLFTPGQGVLTIIAALWLLDVPWKRRCERFLVLRPNVLGALNWMRARTGHDPLQRPADQAADDG
jgi:hypothetical protein